MPINLEKLNRWQRAGVVASIAWIVLASSLYISALDSGYSYTVPKWIVLWHNLNPLSAFIPLFDGEIQMNYLGSGINSSSNLQFSFLGFLFFLSLPIAVIYAIGFGIAWIRKA